MKIEIERDEEFQADQSANSQLSLDRARLLGSGGSANPRPRQGSDLNLTSTGIAQAKEERSNKLLRYENNDRGAASEPVCRPASLLSMKGKERGEAFSARVENLRLCDGFGAARME